jgi:hypothetical protein
VVMLCLPLGRNCALTQLSHVEMVMIVVDVGISSFPALTLTLWKLRFAILSTHGGGRSS